ncbi:MAG: TonB-dependent receptor plug domain-containing protein [Spirochaetes bacterium]|nr:TonB-dependent receptor plug domain-containing protein [Spirochaetota bacterium]
MRKNIVIIFFILLATILYPKEIKIRVVDKDLDIPLEGVKILISELEENLFTDPEGKVSIIIEDSVNRAIVICNLIGYETKKINIKEFDEEVIIQMVIEGFIEGEELVIEESYYNKKDKIGTSVLVDKEELKNLAMRGTIEDVVSSVKTLPGVSYSANFYTDLSVRGGRDDEVAASLDGFIVRRPYYWGSARSIFNPNIVESAVFNNGVFPAKYGMAMSGLLEINTKTPNEGFKVDFKNALSTFETYIQTPVGLKDAGLLFGGRVTYLDLTMGMAWKAQGLYVPRVPYIYDGNLKWYWKPNERFEWYVNGFFGADGIGMGRVIEASEGIESENLMLNDVLHSIGVTGFKILPNDKIFIHCFAGYEFMSMIFSSESEDTGTKDYSSEFNTIYSPAGSSYTVDIKSDRTAKRLLHSFQTRFDTEIELHEKVVFGFGGGLIYDFYQINMENNYFDSILGKDVHATIDYGDSNQFNTSLYLNFNFNLIPDKLQIELGARLDHFVSVMDTNILNTYPAASPRFYIAYTPIRNLAYMEYLTISLGVGLYSKMPEYSYDKEYPIPNFDIKQQKVLTNVLGLEIMFPYGFKIKLESYYKLYFDRYYANSILDNEGNKEYKHHSDGYGHAAGFDIILKRKISRYIDGWISYSFIFARYYNPVSDDQDASEQIIRSGNFKSVGDPNETWYYPSYHRWHSMNIVLNIKPASWLTISPGFGVCSGLPKTIFGDSEMYSSGPPSNQLELYKREEKYSDTERSDVSLPFGIKIDFHFYFPKTKIRFAAYGAIDNVFSLFWNPDQNEIVDKYTGDIVKESPAAYETFEYSFGIKISY